MRTLSCVLAGECGDDRLRDLFVESVQPAPDSTRLLVSIYPGTSAQPWDPNQVLESLHKAAGMLRSKIAGAIHRKRVPDLVYRLVSSADISQSEPPPTA